MAPGGDKVSTQCQRGRICHSIAHSGKGAVAVAGLVVVVLLALRGGYAAASRSLSSVTRALWGGDGTRRARLGQVSACQVPCRWDVRPPDASGSWRCGGGGRPRPRGVATSRAGVPPIGTCPFVLGAMGGVSCLTASIPELIPSPFLSFFPRPKTLLACCPARGSPGLPRCPPAPACVHRVVSTQHWRSGKVAIGMRILVHVLFFLGGLVVG